MRMIQAGLNFNNFWCDNKNWDEMKHKYRSSTHQKAEKKAVQLICRKNNFNSVQIKKQHDRKTDGRKKEGGGVVFTVNPKMVNLCFILFKIVGWIFLELHYSHNITY